MNPPKPSSDPLSPSQQSAAWSDHTLKRALDVVVASAGLLLLFLALLLVAPLIKLTSSGPVFHRARRVGPGGREFTLYKLRTMVEEAERVGPPVTATADPRITATGRVLRALRLDRAPELFNVLRGDMSLVGPAPEDPVFVALYTDEQREVLSVRPGMTSPASQAFADEGVLLSLGSDYARSILPAKLGLDLEYVRGRSFLGDLRILLGLVSPRVVLRLRRLSLARHDWRLWAVIDGPTVAIAYYMALVVHLVDVPQPHPAMDLIRLTFLMPLLIAIYVGFNTAFRLQRRVWRHSLTPEVLPMALASGVSTAVVFLLDAAAGPFGPHPLPPAIVVIGGFFSFAGMVATRYGWRILRGYYRSAAIDDAPRSRTLIYGVGETGQLLTWRLLAERKGAAYHMVGLIDDDPAKLGLRIHGVRVLGGLTELVAIIERENVQLVILAMPGLRGHRLRAIVDVAAETPAQIRIAKGLFDVLSPTQVRPLIREVTLEDLLGREPATVNVADCQRVITGKVVMVTGACGSIGSELCSRIAQFEPAALVALDSNESGIFDLAGELRADHPALALKEIVADVTDAAKVSAVFAEQRPHVVFHVAAYKHVPLMQDYPEEAVRVNIGGTMTVLEAAKRNGTERFVLVSTDKAVNPTSVMGASKRVAEVLVTGEQKQPPICCAVRFGNVMGSRGSVIPTFARQIERGGPVTVTHPEMTRYFMDISEAAILIIQAASYSRGGDLYMLDMGERIRIEDLARKMIRMRGLRPGVDIEIVYSGMRPGEKLHEELAYKQEMVSETPHPLIQRVAVSHLVKRGPELESAVARLLTLARTADRQRLGHELIELSLELDLPAAADKSSSLDLSPPQARPTARTTGGASG